MRTIFIGDVHGCSEELDLLLERCALRADDRVVLLGDLVAKGPDSAGVVRRARELGALAVLGNHDVAALEGRARPRDEVKPDHRQVLETLAPADFAYLERLPRFLRFAELGVIAIHAGFVPGVPLETQDPHDLVNLRSIRDDGSTSKRLDGAPWASCWTGPELALFGHDAMRGLQRYPHAMGLDSGCVYGGELSALVFPERELIQVKAKRAYKLIDEKRPRGKVGPKERAR